MSLASQMIGDGGGATVATGEDGSIAADDVNDRVCRRLHAFACDRSRRGVKKVKVGIEVARHALVKSFREKSQDKSPRKRGVL